jgi:hypothetical protein
MKPHDPWRILPKDVTPDSREWTHFVVFLPDGDLLLLNLSLVGRRDALEEWIEPRTTLLACGSGRGFLPKGWTGGMHTEKDVTWESESGTLEFPHARLAMSANAYRLRLRIEDWSVDLRMEVVGSTAERAIDLGDGRVLNWFVAPRLLATGFVRHDNARLDISGCTCYHDHNWGRFRWGRDVAWDWGHAVDETSAFTWLRVWDGARRIQRTSAVLEWEDGELVHAWNERDVSMTYGDERLEVERTEPPVMRVVAQGTCSAFPHPLSISVPRGRLQAEFVPTHASRIVIPSDGRDVGSVALVEAAGRAKVTIDGTDRVFRCIGEYVHGV